MKNRLYRKDENLVIEIPLFSERFNPYDPDDAKGEVMDNITGVIAGEECGFALLIDRSYKGKGDDVSDLFYTHFGSVEEFREICNGLGLPIVEYPICAYCDKPIYGAFTSGDKGDMCFTCYQTKFKE